MTEPVTYVALLRGINVGGSNIIRMADLKTCFESTDCSDVVTYIQSGNVVFRSEDADAARLERNLEKSLSDRFKYTARLVLLTRKELERVVQRAPRGFGTSPEEFRYDVAFLKKPLKESEAISGIVLKEGVDTAHKGPGVLYFSRLVSKATQSRLAKISSLPVYKDMTIRNWNTTTRLLALMKEAVCEARAK